MKYAVITLDDMSWYRSLEFIPSPIVIQVSETDYKMDEYGGINIHQKYFKDLPNFNHDCASIDPDFKYYFHCGEFDIM